MLEHLGDLTGSQVLELGCGEGDMARLLLEAGASRVHGFDISAEMIARDQQARDPEDVQRAVFDTHDVTKGVDLPLIGFDDAIAVFLFNDLTRR